MAITQDSPFVGVQRITREGFAATLRMLAAPGVANERDAAEYWDAIWRYEIDPLLVLAIFQHESGMGKYGVAQQTRSWGNTRTPSFGAQPLTDPAGLPVTVEGRSGRFPVFGSWLDGCISTAARLASTEYPMVSPYGLRPNIGAIYSDPSGAVWAPAGDLNDPNAYLASVLSFMNDHEESVPVPTESPLPIRQAFIKEGSVNRPGTPITITAITIHETANPNPGADAEAHRVFVWGGGGPDTTSYTFVVDDHEIIQLLPIGEAQYHAGTFQGNHSGISIELCVNIDGDWEATKTLGARLVASLLDQYHLALADVLQHKFWTGKNCPTKLLREPNGWQKFLADVQHWSVPNGDSDPNDAALEAYWQAHQDELGEKRDPGAGHLAREWAGAKVLLCERGAIAADAGQAWDITAHLMDDFVTYSQNDGSLVLYRE